MSDQEAAKPQEQIKISPSDIAEMSDAAAKAAAVKGTQQDVGMDRSGQLSAPHTPGHTVNRR